MTGPLWEDFCAFAKAQLASTDIDPVYPVLRWQFALEGLPPTQVLWRLLLFVAFYHLGSAERWWTAEPEYSYDALTRMTASETGIERRGMRGNIPAVRAFLHDAWAMVPKVIDRVADTGGQAGWRLARTEMELCRYAGPWTSYKWADLLKYVYGAPITADDIGVGGNGATAGPVPGLALLTGKDWKTCATDTALQADVYAQALAAQVSFGGLDQFETCLCDFNSLTKGRYYVGADIDAMQLQLGPSSALWVSRQAVIPFDYLGELNGWVGVDAALKKAYATTGRLTSRLDRLL